jgi:hypothetical protein
MITLSVVTVTPADTDRPPASVKVTVQVPPFTDVTLKVALGPFALVGATVAIPLHVFDSANEPVYVASVTVSCCVTPVLV